MKWSSEYSIGIPEIDEQHKVLFACIERLESPAEANPQGLAMYYVMDQLNDYVRVHFAVEEIVMRLFDYPGLDAHAAEHRAFAARLKLLEKNQLDHDVHAEAGKYLREWLEQHVLVSDKAYAEFLLKKGAAPP